MGQLRLAANTIENLINAVGHLQVVYVDDVGNQTEIEVQAPLSTDISLLPTQSIGSWVFERARDHTITGPGGNTSNYGVVGEYDYEVLD